MPQARIAILTVAHLCHNPRAYKEAATLADAGYAVEVYGIWFDRDLRARDRVLLKNAPFRYTPVVDIADRTAGARFRGLILRAQTKLGQLAFRWARRENAWQLGLAISALRRLTRAADADLFIGHSERALVVCREFLRAGRRVGVDLEDWFSEDLLPAARRTRPLRLLRDLEKDLLVHGSYASCPSRAMSEAVADEFRCPVPHVVYNAFPLRDRAAIDGLVRDRRDTTMPSLHWYSQTLGHGRGLEELFAALPAVTRPLQIHLRGHATPDFSAWWPGQVPASWRERIFIHPLVSNAELLSRIAEHDIGFAGEQKYCRSRDLTITNKILHYLLGGLAVVASDTQGQREVATRAPGAVLLYDAAGPDSLAHQLNQLLDAPTRLQAAKAAARDAAESTFSWERVAPVVVEGVRRALTVSAVGMPT